MPRLAIALEDGFVDDHVVVAVDGRVVLDRHGIRTRTQLGLAWSTTVDAPDRCRVEVRLPRRGRSAALDVDVRRTPNVRFSVTPDGLSADASDKPLFYA
jgi:hypothetical protein